MGAETSIKLRRKLASWSTGVPQRRTRGRSVLTSIPNPGKPSPTRPKPANLNTCNRGKAVINQIAGGSSRSMNLALGADLEARQKFRLYDRGFGAEHRIVDLRTLTTAGGGAIEHQGAVLNFIRRLWPMPSATSTR